MIEIQLNMRAVPSPRPRFSKTGTYMPENYRRFKEALKWRFKPFKSFGKQLVKLELEFVFSQPSINAMNKRKYSEPVGDADNLAKSIMDAMNGILFDDDTVVVELNVKKYYGERDMILIKMNTVV